MPVVIPVIIGAAVTYGLVAIGTYVLVAQIAGAIVAAGAAKAFGKTPAARTFDDIARGVLLNTASTIDQIPVVYGSRRMGATRVFSGLSGASNEYLNNVYAICEGEISAINTVYLDNVASTDARYSGLTAFEKHLGTDDQVASAALIAELTTGSPGSSPWTTDHRGAGVAYVWAKLQFSPDSFNGMPVVNFDVDGKIVYDPRVAGSPSTFAFSDNPALCILDYLINTRYGRGIPLADIDLTTFITAADYCDEPVSVPAAGSPSFTTQKRYTCNGVVNPDSGPMENLRSLLTSCRGAIIWSAGKYKLVLDCPTAASTFEFTADNIIGSWSIHLPGKREKVNRIRARFFNPDRSWQPDIAVVDSPTYRAEDNGLMLERTIDLPFTTDIYMAQQIAQIDMKQSRIGITASFTAAPEAMRCEVGDVVPITHSTPGWSSKLFRVTDIELVQSHLVRVSVREYDETVYDLDTLSLAAAAPATNLPDMFTVSPPTALTFTQSTTVWDSAILTWTAPTDAFIAEYQVEFKLADDSTWTIHGKLNGTEAVITKLRPRIYDFRVKAINTLGVSSSYATTDGNIDAPTIMPMGQDTGLGHLRKVNSVSIASNTEGLAFIPTINALIVPYSAGVQLINPVSDIVMATIPTNTVTRMSYCAENDRVYMPRSSGGSTTVDVFDPVTRTVESSFTVDFAAARGVLCPTNACFYLRTSENVTVLDVTGSPTNNIRTTISTGTLGQSAQIIFCPSNGYIYTPEPSNDRVKVIDPATNTGVTTIAVGDAPTGICWCPDNDRIYCFNQTDRTISVIHPHTHAVVETIRRGAYMSLSGNNGGNASTPDATKLDISGPFEIRAYVALDDWTPSTIQTVLAKWSTFGSPGGDQRSYALLVTATGLLRLQTSTDGSNTLNNDSTVAPTVTNGQGLWIRATLTPLDASGDRVARFYTSNDRVDIPWDQVNWDKLGTTVTTAGSGVPFSGSAVLEVGSQDGGASNNMAGKVYRAQLFDGIDGDRVADFDARRISGTTGTGETGETWTINNTGSPSVAQIVQDSSIGLGTHLCYCPSSRLIYFLDITDNEIVALQPSTNRIIASTAVSAQPRALVWCPSVSKLYSQTITGSNSVESYSV